MKVIMYHYVRPKSKTNGNLRYLTTDQFNKQLDYFEKNFGFLSPEEFKYYMDNKISTEKVLLTFDDGLIDHFKYVFQILKERELKGFFFIPTSIFDSKVLNVHKTHFLLKNYNSKKIHSLIIELMNDSEFKFEKKYANASVYKFSKHEEFEFEVKKLLNYILDFKSSEFLLKKIFQTLNLDEKDLTDIYLNEYQLNEMYKEGQVIGSHTVNHKILSSLDYKNQKEEITKSFQRLNNYINPLIKTISYPFGYEFTYDISTLKVLDEEKVRYGFIFDNKENKRFHKYEISREDCNKYLDI